jgi:hypothetical protein
MCAARSELTGIAPDIKVEASMLLCSELSVVAPDIKVEGCVLLF